MPTKNPFSSLHEETRRKVFDVLKDRVTAAIEANEDLRWDSLLSRVDGFVNITTGRAYLGWTNRLLLAFTSMACGGDPRFLTFRQMKTLSGGKGMVKKGSKLTPIFAPIIKDIENEDGSEKTVPILTGYRTAWVANVAQTNLVEIGLVPEEWLEPNRDPAPDSAVMDFVSRVPFKKTTSTGAPFYNPRTDEIGMPDVKQFKSAYGFEGSLAHELIHWTGAKDRLDRELSTWRNTPAYSHEELVACLGSSFLLANLGVELSEEEVTNSSAYLKGWLEPLSQDIEILVSAAAEATRAVNYLFRVAGEEKKHEAA